MQLWAHATTRKHQASVLYLWVLGRMAGLCGTFPEVTLAQVFFCFFLVSVNLSLRLVVVFQSMPAWNYLESNISRSFVLQDPQRSVSCIPKTFLSLVLFVSFSLRFFFQFPVLNLSGITVALCPVVNNPNKHPYAYGFNFWCCSFLFLLFRYFSLNNVLLKLTFSSAVTDWVELSIPQLTIKGNFNPIRLFICGGKPSFLSSLAWALCTPRIFSLLHL